MTGAVQSMAGLGIAGIVGVPPSGTNVGGASWIMNNDGTYNVDGAGVGSWCAPNGTGIAAGYQVKTVVNSGTFNTDPSAGAFIDCSSTRLWQKTAVGTVNFTVTIREKVTGIVRATATKTLTVT